VALHGAAELQHRLKAAAAGVVHNGTLIVVCCRGRNAIIYLLNWTETKPYGIFWI